MSNLENFLRQVTTLPVESLPKTKYNDLYNVERFIVFDDTFVS